VCDEGNSLVAHHRNHHELHGLSHGGWREMNFRWEPSTAKRRVRDSACTSAEDAPVSSKLRPVVTGSTAGRRVLRPCSVMHLVDR
jgi:hypothetical protein